MAAAVSPAQPSGLSGTERLTIQSCCFLWGPAAGRTPPPTGLCEAIGSGPLFPAPLFEWERMARGASWSPFPPGSASPSKT